PKSTKWNEFPKNPQVGPAGTTPSSEFEESHQIRPACATARTAASAGRREDSAPLDEADTGPSPFARAPLDRVHRLLDGGEAAPRLGVVARQRGARGGGARREVAAVAHLDLEAVAEEGDRELDRLAARARAGVLARVDEHLVESEQDRLAGRHGEPVRLEERAELRADHADRVRFRGDPEIDGEQGFGVGRGHGRTLERPRGRDKESGRARPRAREPRSAGLAREREREVERRRRMRERADGDAIDARLGERADVLERDAAGRLEADALARMAGAHGGDRGAHALGLEVVEQHEGGPAVRGAQRLVGVEHLDPDDAPRPRGAEIAASIGRGAPARARSPPKSRWLLLIRTWSHRPTRWFTPPPAATARLSNGRRPGAVLRVSRIATPVPTTASTKRRVRVAIPDIRCTRFKSVRSAARSARARPRRTATTVPAATLVPSATTSRARAAGSRRRATRSARSTPATIPAALAVRFADASAPAGTTASAVASPRPR